MMMVQETRTETPKETNPTKKKATTKILYIIATTAAVNHNNMEKRDKS